jgi:hypothetical protein
LTQQASNDDAIAVSNVSVIQVKVVSGDTPVLVVDSKVPPTGL